MESIEGVNLSNYIGYLEQLLTRCEQGQSQLKHTIGVLSSDEITGDAATMHLIEFVPNISENGIPILNEENSSNVFAIAPAGTRFLTSLVASLESPKYNPQTELVNFMAETCANLRLLALAQNEALRALVMNRFRIIDSMQNGNNTKTSLHTMRLVSNTTQIGETFLIKAASFHRDMKFISQS